MLTSAAALADPFRRNQTETEARRT